MKHICFRSIVICITAAIALPSCTLFRFAYSPTIQNVPGFKEKNESRLNTVMSSPASGTETNFALQGAYAVTNHVALIAGYNGTIKGRDELTYTDNSGSSTDVVEYKRNSAEFGAGVFFPLSPNKKAVFEAYAGYGFGTNKITDRTNSAFNYHNSKTNRYFIQPVLSFHPSDAFTVSTSFRYTNIGYTNISTSYTGSELSSYNLSELPLQRLAFLEPALVLSGGVGNVPWVRIQCQMNFSFYVSGPNINYRSNYFSFGFQFDPVQAIKSGKN